MPTLSYQTAGREDVSPLFHFSKDLIDTYEDLSSIDYDKVLTWVRKKLENHIGEYQVILCQNQKAGYLHFTESGEKMELDDLYIMPQYRGLGIGTAAINHCIASADRPIFLYVFTKNFRAVNLYFRMGFR